MQAEFRGYSGQAFTDMYGDFTGKLSDIVAMDLKNNFRRAVFVSSLNAVLRNLGLVDKTLQCRDNEPRECSHEPVKYLERSYGNSKISKPVIFCGITFSGAANLLGLNHFCHCGH